MFDTVNGLPVHPLVVHSVVVLLPLMAVFTFAVALRPSWRRFAPVAVLGDAVVVGLTFVAKESGEQLQARLAQFQPGVAQEHSEQGDLLPYFAIGLLVAALLVWGGRRASALVPVSILVSLLAGAAGVYWVVRVGDSGATAVWKETIANTRPPSGS